MGKWEGCDRCWQRTERVGTCPSVCFRALPHIGCCSLGGEYRGQRSLGGGENIRFPARTKVQLSVCGQTAVFAEYRAKETERYLSDREAAGTERISVTFISSRHCDLLIYIFSLTIVSPPQIFCYNLIFAITSLQLFHVWLSLI